MTDRSKYLESLRTGISQRSLTIGVVGLGYVGLPVAVSFAEAGFHVIGLDVDAARVAMISEGHLPIAGDEPGLASALASVIAQGRLVPSTDYRALSDANVVTINVQTPLASDNSPDLSVLVAASVQIAEVLRPGSLVVVESTVPPGTTMDCVVPILERRGDLRLGENLFVGACPERVMPGVLLSNIKQVDRVVGGSDSDVSELMAEFYATVVRAHIESSDPMTAEMVKVVENAYRDVQIAFANEVALVCADLGLDVWRVRELVNRVPFRNMHSPGGGVGGHCIPKDSWLLAAASARPLKVITAARDVNESMPAILAEAADAALRTRKSSGRRIAVLGVAYLPGSDDARNSPALALAEHAATLGLTTVLHDPYVEAYQGSLTEVLASVDLVIVVTPHEEYSDMDVKLPVIDARHLKDALLLAGDS
jgi:UDP-N-acetyl-D-mannosaminuronic acid dehydrogenase